MDRRDHRLGRALDDVFQVEEADAPRRLAEFRNVGAGDECLAFANQHNGVGLRIGNGLPEGLRQSVTDFGGERIHRRRIDGDDGNFALARKFGNVIHGAHGCCP